MILNTMTYKEVYDNYMRDQSKVLYWRNKYADKYQKTIKPNCPIQVKHQIEKNDYIISLFTENRVQLFEYYFLPFFNNNQRLLLVCQETPWIAPWGEEVVIPGVHLYTMHFLERYNERFLNSLRSSLNEVAGVFFGRNIMRYPVKVTDAINRNIGKYSENSQLGFKIRDGFCFTVSASQDSQDSPIPMAVCHVYTTFVGNKDLSEEQSQAIADECAKTLSMHKNLLG